MKSPLAALAAVLLVACQQATPAPTFTADDEAQVRALFDSVVADVRADNDTVWAGRFSENARFHAANQPAVVGRSAILAWGASFPPVESFSFENVEVHGSGTVAWGTSAVLVKLKDLPADTSKQLVVMEKDSGGKWWVVAVSLNSDLPIAAPPPPPVRR